MTGAASLALLKHIITHRDTRRLLVIGAYPDRAFTPERVEALSLLALQA